MIDFNSYVKETSLAHGPLVQPRMGMASIAQMRRGLLQTARANPATVCTITLDSFTRLRAFDKAQAALDAGDHLNGFPIMAHAAEAIAELVDTVTFETGRPIQVRHGSAMPSPIFARLADAGITATEGGPVSYCLPYSRQPLRDAIDDWRKGCAVLAEASNHSHIESFAGCMMGQLADPALLIALNILEARFLMQSGIASVSCSYAQGINPRQDRAALRALRSMMAEYVPKVPSHIVVYAFMGLFPQSLNGYCRINHDIMATAKSEGAERIIVKTPVESRRIPTVDENIASLDFAHFCMSDHTLKIPDFDDTEYHRVHQRARDLVEAALDLHPDPGEALLRAFATGTLDVPYCLHDANKNAARTKIVDGYYRHSDQPDQTTQAFLEAVRFNQTQYDNVL